MFPFEADHVALSPKALEIETSEKCLGGIALIWIDMFSAITENSCPRQSMKHSPISDVFSLKWNHDHLQIQIVDGVLPTKDFACSKILRRSKTASSKIQSVGSKSISYKKRVKS